MAGTDPTAPVTGNSKVGPTAPSSADPTTAAAVASSNASAETKGNVKFSSLEDLRKKAPKVYNQLMLSIATTIIRGMNDHQERLKKMRQEARDNVNG